MLKDLELAKAQGKEYILYAPKIGGTVEKNLREAGVNIVKNPEALENEVKSLNK